MCYATETDLPLFVGSIIGQALAEHPVVRKLGFTGSTDTGKIVMRACADSNLKKTSLELGGKSPFIIFSDCDMDRAVRLVRCLGLCLVLFRLSRASSFPDRAWAVSSSTKEKTASRPGGCLSNAASTTNSSGEFWSRLTKWFIDYMLQLFSGDFNGWLASNLGRWRSTGPWNAAWTPES